MSRKLRLEDLVDTVIDSLNNCDVYGTSLEDEVEIAQRILYDLNAEGVLDDREVDL